MCDYSLMGVPNRLAKDGEDLLVHRFRTGSVGFASARDLCLADPPQTRGQGFGSVLRSFFNPPGIDAVPAVCIPPGAHLMLRDVPTYLQRDFEIGPEEEVVFTQLTASEYSYRDAIRFKSGREILLQRLREGQRVKVLDLSSTEVVEPVREEQPDQVFRRR